MSLTVTAPEPTTNQLPGLIDSHDAPTGGQIISFTIDDNVFGIDILCVREIRVWQPTTPLPNTPHFIRGVVNLRGIITPILDFRARLGRGETDATPTHVVIIVMVANRVFGLLVDTVSDIIDLKAEQVQPVPESITFSGDDVISNLATVGDQMISLIDLELIVGDLVHG